MQATEDKCAFAPCVFDCCLWRSRLFVLWVSEADPAGQSCWEMWDIMGVAAHGHESETTRSSTLATLMRFVHLGVMVVSMSELSGMLVGFFFSFLFLFLNHSCQAAQRIKMARAGQGGSHPVHLPGADCKWVEGRCWAEYEGSTVLHLQIIFTVDYCPFIATGQQTMNVAQPHSVFQ